LKRAGKRLAKARRFDRPTLRNYVGRADRSVQRIAQNLDFGKLRLTLFGEFRRLTLAVKEHRSPTAGKPV
jgi:hypothetical protein